MSKISSGLTFDQLRAANIERIPLFKNGRGEIAHPSHECKDPAVPGSDWTINDWVTAVTGELGEFANIAKKVRRGDLAMGEARHSMAKELADVACYLDILAMQCGVDLGQAVIEKFNEVSDRIGVSVKLG